jgi:hypothetical protein
MTLASVNKQLRLASYGVKSHVEEVRTADGVKDKIAQNWINIMLERSAALKISEPHLTADENSACVLAWLATKTTRPYSPILDMKCTSIKYPAGIPQ